MSRESKKTPDVIPAWRPVRDYLLVSLINGATKSGVHRDRKKEANKKACRGKVKHD